MTVNLLTEYNLEFLSLKGGCTGSSEFTLVKMPHCWKSHVRAQIKTCIHQRVVINWTSMIVLGLFPLLVCLLFNRTDPSRVIRLGSNSVRINTILMENIQ